MTAEIEDPPTSGEARQVLAALDDPTCRRIVVETLEDPLTAGELVDRCERSRSTVYRKLRLLAESGLLERRPGVGPGRADEAVFEPAADAVRVEFGGADGVAVEVGPGDGE